jgi:O-antigen/teichoic acid export membrane protein
LKKLISEFANSKYVLLINVADKLFSFVILLLLARNFPTEQYGQVVTLLSLSMVFITIFDLGLPIYSQREISIKSSNASNIFSKIFSLAVILFTAYIVLIFIVYMILFSAIPFILFLIIALMIYVASLVTLCNRTLSGLYDFKSQFVSFTIPRMLILLFFIIGIIIFTPILNILMLFILFGFSLNLILVLIYLKNKNVNYSPKIFSFKDALLILKLSMPIGLAVIFNLLYDKLDLLLISKLSNYTEAAFYNVGYGLFKGAALSFSFLLVPAFTKISSIGRNKAEVNNFFRNYARIILSICIPISIILYFCSELIIKLLYTDKFSSSVAVLEILSFGLAGLGLNNLAGVTLNGMGYFKVVMYITMCGLIMNVVLNAALIPHFGIKAACSVSVLTEYFVFFTELYYLKKFFK